MGRSTLEVGSPSVAAQPRRADGLPSGPQALRPVGAHAARCGLSAAPPSLSPPAASPRPAEGLTETDDARVGLWAGRPAGPSNGARLRSGRAGQGGAGL